MVFRSVRNISVACSDTVFFGFMTDIRNFGKFVPESMKHGWKAETDCCIFTIAGIGELRLAVKSETPVRQIVYSGNALSRIDFTLEINVIGNNGETSAVKLEIKAEMDPLTKAIIAPNIEKFIDLIVMEMEKFRGWEKE